MLEQMFKLKENGTDVRTEVIAGITTFMTMAYIIFVNPGILSAAGVPFSGAMVATALAAGLITIVMGLATNYPFALASGMGLNAFVAFGLVKGMGLTWQTAMGMVFLEGVVITLLVLTNFREAVMNAIPITLKRAIGVGIGLFIAFIGLQSAKFVVASPATLVQLGSFHKPETLVAAVGLVITAFLVARRVKGGILLGILITTVIALFAGVTKLPTGAWVSAKLDTSTIMALDVRSALNIGLWTTIFALMITDFFDTMGTVIAIGGEAGFLDKEGRLPRLKNVLLVDSMAAVLGGVFGASSVTTYIESAAGVGEGGRTGLTAVVTGILFLLAVFLAPVAGIVPAAATAPALIIVGFLMMTVVKDIRFDEYDEAIPAFLILLGIPLTYNISYGIGLGFVSYVVIKALRGKFDEIHPLMWIVALAFAVNFFFQGR
ncbi:MAG: NCS2 family permease [Bacillota bacterium]|nr:NCS2 family permease [Bacillota bacterium]